MKTIGMVLIVIGIVMTLITGFNVITKKKVVDLGKVEINKEEKTPIYWSPVLGIVLIGSGILFTVSSRRKTFD
jgi:uncharacterized iron-regulated membrane protein